VPTEEVLRLESNAVVPRLRPVPLNDLARDDGSLGEATQVARATVASGHYLAGPNVAAFEQALAGELGSAGVAAVASGTDALALAMAALELPQGSRVIVPANAGGYASVAARQTGLVPLVADVDPQTLLVTAETVATVATPNVKAVVVTHLYGQVVPHTEEIRAWCDASGRSLIEDCAQAAGARRGGAAAGSIGHAAAFSFYPTKNLAAMGDAGAVAAQNAELLGRVRQLAQYGWRERYLVERPLGRNSRMDELQAAILRVRLPRLAELNRRRHEIAQAYADAVMDGPLSIVGAGAQPEENVGHLAVLLCDDRAGVQEHLAARQQIATAVHYPYPDHAQRALGAEVGPGGAPVAEDACRRVLTVPCFPTMTDDEVSRVAQALRSYGRDREVSS
jgi:aminotransferase EvaB